MKSILCSGVIAAALVAGSVQTTRAEDAAAAPATSQPASAGPIDYKKLKDLVPDKLTDLKRTNLEGQKISAGDLNMSQVTAQFGPEEGKENAPEAHVEITDYAATKAVAEGLTAWQSLTIDKEGDSGIEKTFKIEDQPAYETWQADGKSGQVMLFVAKRYLVTVNGTNVTADQLKKLAEALPIKKLAELK